VGCATPCWNVPFPIILSDFRNCEPIASLLKCNFSYIYAAVEKISTVSASCEICAVAELLFNLLWDSSITISVIIIINSKLHSKVLPCWQYVAIQQLSLSRAFCQMVWIPDPNCLTLFWMVRSQVWADWPLPGHINTLSLEELPYYGSSGVAILLWWCTDHVAEVSQAPVAQEGDQICMGINCREYRGRVSPEFRVGVR